MDWKPEESDWLCIHAPRKEWRNRLPIKITVVRAFGRNAALAKFIPFHPNDPETKHYNKPYALLHHGTHFIG
jgi:hypothetical protein